MPKHVKILLCVLFLAVPSVVMAQMQDKYITYINQYKNLAVDQMIKYKIPASITLAQALLESGAGNSVFTRNTNNHFGIKCGSSWTGAYYVMDDDYSNEHFRVYPSAEQSYEDHSKFLSQNRRYAGLFQLDITDYRGWARGLKAAGYATNPNYAASLIQIIENYELNRLDKLSVSNRHHQPITIQQESSLHPVYMNNKNFYTIARQGDTFKSISREMGVSVRKLIRYNELDKHYVLQAGDVIYFEKKQRQADKKYKGIFHRLVSGESIYLVSQSYGVRLKTLYKINHLSPEYSPKVGDLILLRK